MYIRSLTWVYCICHQVYCICHHLTSGATLGCTTLAIKCTAEAMLYFRSLTWVYYICHQVYCRDMHIQYIRSPTWVNCICNCELHTLSCSSEASLGCTVFANRCTGFTIKCTAEAIMYIRSLNWVYCTCHQVHCICHHLTSGATLGCTISAIKCTAEAMLYFRSPTWVYCICHYVMHILSMNILSSMLAITRSDISPHAKLSVSQVNANTCTHLIFLRCLCGYVWVTILTLSPWRVF